MRRWMRHEERPATAAREYRSSSDVTSDDEHHVWLRAGRLLREIDRRNVDDERNDGGNDVTLSAGGSSDPERDSSLESRVPHSFCR